jgi:hypothetical protein
MALTVLTEHCCVDCNCGQRSGFGCLAEKGSVGDVS